MIDNKSIIQPNTTPILFVNFSDENYEIKWDGKVQATLEGKESRWLPFWLAVHASKALVDREMGKRSLASDHFSREDYVAKCIGNKPEEKNDNSDPLGIEALNKNMSPNQETKEVIEQPKKKMGRPKKSEVPKEEDKFEG
jgi:hypothetical protein